LLPLVVLPVFCFSKGGLILKGESLRILLSNSSLGGCIIHSTMPEIPLIATKFYIPSTHLDLVTRPRLHALLENGTRQPLTVISAPPGFGKTTLVTGWIQSLGKAPVAWLSLEKTDNQLPIFWRYFISALQLVQPDLGDTVLQTLGAAAPPAMEIALATLINELATLAAPLIMVLDDYQFIQSPDIHASLNFLLDHQPAMFHLVILTREDPPLALARRRARRQMIEIRAADLRFSAEETAAFLNSTMSLSLTPDQINLLDLRTEGWIVGLQMAALSLQGRDPHTFFDSLASDDRYITDYLIEEVLQHQTETVRNFLLKTSILERMCTPLCSALLDGAEVDLPGLERSNLFLIPMDTSRTWYRYHHLFAELLRQRLHEIFPSEEISRLYHIASLWCETHEDVHAAVRYARHIPDERRVAQILAKYMGNFFLLSELPQLVDFANFLSDPLREANPNLSMAVAWAAVATNQDPEPWLESIERHFGLPAQASISDPSLDPARRAALLEVLIVRQQLPLTNYGAETHQRLLAIQEQFDGLPPEQFCLFNPIARLRPVLTFDLGLDSEASGSLQAAACFFTETVSFAREFQNSHLLHYALGHLANIQVAQSHLRAARQTHEKALAEIQAGSISPYAGLHHAGLGNLNYEWGDLGAAEKHFDQALTLARLWNQWESLLPALSGLARIRRKGDDRKLAYSFLDELKKPPADSQLLSINALRALWKAQDGDSDSAAAWLESSGLTDPYTANPGMEPVLMDVARTLIQLGRLEEGMGLAQKIISLAKPNGRLHMVIQGNILLAKAYSLQDNSNNAIEFLTEALRMAEPEGYLNTFLDEGEPIHILLTKLTGNGYAARLLTGFDTGMVAPAKKGTGSRSTEILSEREQEVIQLVAEGLSNQEIAERLVISLPTVKTHIGNIFNKLGVSSRTRAIASAESLGFIRRD
jgi:LuxR family maltose regulon positive regulatory protein